MSQIEEKVKARLFSLFFNKQMTKANQQEMFGEIIKVIVEEVYHHQMRVKV